MEQPKLSRLMDQPSNAKTLWQAGGRAAGQDGWISEIVASCVPVSTSVKGGFLVQKRL